MAKAIDSEVHGDQENSRYRAYLEFAPHFGGILMRRLLMFFTAACVAGAGVAYWALKEVPLDDSALASAGIVLMPSPRELPDVQLATADGQSFGPKFFAGKWTMVLFGYTFCPDICPTALSELRQVYLALPSESRELMGVTMVSVDPHRDTPERTQQYVTYFDPSFTAMTGELAAVQQASSVIGLPFVPGDTSQPNYPVVHTGNLALIDPEGRQVGFVRGPLKVDQLIKILPGFFEQSR